MARTRITIDTEEAYKRAFAAWASLDGMSPQELFQKLLDDNCPADIMKRAKNAAPVDGEEKEKRGKK